MGDLLSPWIATMAREGSIERGTKYVLRMLREMISHPGRKIRIRLVGHRAGSVSLDR